MFSQHQKINSYDYLLKKYGKNICYKCYIQIVVFLFTIKDSAIFANCLLIATGQQAMQINTTLILLTCTNLNLNYIILYRFNRVQPTVFFHSELIQKGGGDIFESRFIFNPKLSFDWSYTWI